MATDAQNRATANYRKQNVKQITVRLYPKEAELYAWIKEAGGSTYLKRLALIDMRAHVK